MVWLVLIFVLTGLVFGQDVGKVERYKGRVDLVKKGALRGMPVDVAGSVIGVGDLVRTKTKSYALLSFIDGSQVELKERSRLKVIAYEKSRDVRVQRGIVKFDIKSAKGLKGFRVMTPHAIIGVKGTTFWVYVFPGYTKVVIEEGKVEYVYPMGNEPKSSNLLKFISVFHEKEDPFSEKPPAPSVGNLEVIIQ